MKLCVLVAALLASVLVVGVRAAQEPRRWVAVDGRDWAGFAPKEKQAYVVGFLSGAAAAVSRSGDTAVTRTSVEALSRGGGLQFPFGPMVYVTQLDEFYWWENQVPTPVYVALLSINQRLRQPQPTP
jgi:hypothetical protein